MQGVGLKWDYVGSDPDGLFVGLEAGYSRYHYTLESVGETVDRDRISVGVRGGHRMSLGESGLYIVPWVGIGHGFLRGEEVVIHGETFERSAVGVFPTVHLGWRF